MLTITVYDTDEQFDEENNVFVKTPIATLDFEHSLATLASWESKWKRPFIGNDDKTTDETLDYVLRMLQTPDVPAEVLSKLSQDDYNTIAEYINEKQTATWFKESQNQPRQTRIYTAELIYYWMTAHGINWEAQHWHLSRLLTLIQVFNEEGKSQDTKKKFTKDDLAARREENRRRLKQYNTRG